jgi:polar amino acid transport system substrate-binding protein
VKKLFVALSLLLLFSLILTACGGTTQKSTTEETVAPMDKLSEIQKRGTLVVSSDPAYPPQSQLVEGAQRPTNTKCTSDQQTSTELQGFDIDVAKELATRLGVEVCFTTPDWTLITGGNWADRWDVSVGSMTITPERLEKLYFSQPYYSAPAAFFVHKDNTTFQTPADLSGKKVGACTGCTYDAFLAGTLQIPGEKMDYVVKDPVFTGYDTDINALQDLALGDGVRLDAVLTALPTGTGAISDGLPLKQLGDPVFFEYLAAAVDKSSDKDPIGFVNELTKLIVQMHVDGTLAKLSNQYYGLDLASAAAKFDWEALNQITK